MHQNLDSFSSISIFSNLKFDVPLQTTHTSKFNDETKHERHIQFVNALNVRIWKLAHDLVLMLLKHTLRQRVLVEVVSDLRSGQMFVGLPRQRGLLLGRFELVQVERPRKLQIDRVQIAIGHNPHLEYTVRVGRLAYLQDLPRLLYLGVGRLLHKVGNASADVAHPALVGVTWRDE